MTIQLLSFDIDNTLINEQSLDGVFTQTWQQLPADARPLLCLNTGRLLDDTIQLIHNQVLPKPDYIISGVGTNIYDFGRQQVLKEFTEILEEGWDLQRVQDMVAQLP